MKDKLRRLERAARDHLESFELEDGSRYWYDPLDTAKELFLHSIDRLRAESIEDLPEPPEIYLKFCQARDPAAVLERFIPSDKPTWFIELPYDRNVLITEQRLVPISHEPPVDLSE